MNELHCYNEIVICFLRIKLNEETQISILATDRDGDSIICRFAKYVELLPLSVVPHTNITENVGTYVNFTIIYLATPLFK